MESQSTSIAKRESTEFATRNARLQDEIDKLQRDKDHLTGHITTLQQQVN